MIYPWSGYLGEVKVKDIDFSRIKKIPLSLVLLLVWVEEQGKWIQRAIFVLHAQCLVLNLLFCSWVFVFFNWLEETIWWTTTVLVACFFWLFGGRSFWILWWSSLLLKEYLLLLLLFLLVLWHNLFMLFIRTKVSLSALQPWTVSIKNLLEDPTLDKRCAHFLLLLYLFLILKHLNYHSLG